MVPLSELHLVGRHTGWYHVPHRTLLSQGLCVTGHHQWVGVLASSPNSVSAMMNTFCSQESNKAPFIQPFLLCSTLAFGKSATKLALKCSCRNQPLAVCSVLWLRLLPWQFFYPFLMMLHNKHEDLLWPNDFWGLLGQEEILIYLCWKFSLDPLVFPPGHPLAGINIAHGTIL